MKNHSYYYWFCFPCPLTPTLTLEKPVQKLLDQPQLAKVVDILKELPPKELLRNFFVLQTIENKVKCLSIKDFVKGEVSAMDLDKVYFCFADNSEHEYPSWLMRVFASFLLYKWYVFQNKINGYL